MLNIWIRVSVEFCLGLWMFALKWFPNKARGFLWALKEAEYSAKKTQPNLKPQLNESSCESSDVVACMQTSQRVFWPSGVVLL